jgi:hypothetical protein
MYVVHNENREGDDDERQFVHLSFSLIETREKKKKSVNHVQSVQ